MFYEYSSFNSSQEFFLHFGIWKSHSKQFTLEPNFGDQNLVKFGTQQGGGDKEGFGARIYTIDIKSKLFSDV